MSEKKLFKFSVSKETFIAIGMGLIVVILSLLMDTKIATQNIIVGIILRDWLMIVCVGVSFVLWRAKSKGIKYFGISSDKLLRNIIINIILAIALFFIMYMGLKEEGEVLLNVNKDTLSKALFILLAGIFEVMFFYSYQRVIFTESFGKIPAIILCSLFYSFHHAGFQPEFIKLFFVGISFVLVVVLTNNAFSIFPFYWSVGAILDVLVQSEVVSDINIPFIRSIIIIVLIVICGMFYVRNRKRVQLSNKEDISN